MMRKVLSLIAFIGLAPRSPANSLSLDQLVASADKLVIEPVTYKQLPVTDSPEAICRLAGYQSAIEVQREEQRLAERAKHYIIADDAQGFRAFYAPKPESYNAVGGRKVDNYIYPLTRIVCAFKK